MDRADQHVLSAVCSNVFQHAGVSKSNKLVSVSPGQSREADGQCKLSNCDHLRAEDFKEQIDCRSIYTLGKVENNVAAAAVAGFSLLGWIRGDRIPLLLVACMHLLWNRRPKFVKYSAPP